MLYKFKTKNSADVIMVEATGRQMLEIIGKDASATGIIQQSQVATAIAALEAAIADQEQRTRSDHDDDKTPPSDEPSLRQRATPFMAMLRTCEQDGGDVVWGV